MQAYNGAQKIQFTVKIPYVAPRFATLWHPTEATGPFSTLVRGSFSSEIEAIKWAKNNLEGCPYSVEAYPIY